MGSRRPRRPQWVYWVRRAMVLAMLVAVLVLPVALLSRCGGGEPGEAGPIGQSRPVEMVVPQIGLRAEFEEGDCRVKDGAINPASMGKACAYTAEGKPYQLPGPGAGDLVVVAGHTGAAVHGVFDGLYDARANAHNVREGDTLYLRTQDSRAAGKWLEYRATDLHNPKKEGLADDASVWGTEPMPGRLLTISCIQPVNPLAAAVRNAVVGWQFAGVVDDATVDAAE